MFKAYFSKHGFTEKLCQHGFHVISRMRDDADLLYKYTGERSHGRGRPKKYDGKVGYGNLDMGHFTASDIGEGQRSYHARVWSRSLKRDINLVVVKTLKKGKWSHNLYFSTDLVLTSKDILEYYRGVSR